MSLFIHSTCDVRKLPIADPNLLPFHIAHTGPAPVSTYFLTQPAKEEVGAPEGAKAAASGVSLTPGEAPTTGEAPAITRTVATADAPSTSSTMDTVPSSVPAPASTTNVSGSSQTSKRLVSSFRGRTVHGLRVDVPPGYLGVVLRADGELATSRPRGTRPQDKGRRGRSGAATEEGEEDAMMAEDDEAIEDTRPSRILSPASQFSSFMVWGADIPVDEGRDDYIRALTEWTALAGEIHRMY